MKILSLFDGMACGMIAMLNAGVSVDRYIAYEIDKYAVKTASHNFPIIEQRGDVFCADFTEFDGFDWLIGGSPCTHWSIAQTKDRETKVSRDEKGNILLHSSGIGFELFSQYLRALHEVKPRFFIYENNKSMSKDIREAITECFGFEPTCINSALVSAQNRQRLYWVGRRNADGTYSKVNIEQPEDRRILLKDVLDNAVAIREKAHAVIASDARTTEREFFIKNQGNMVAESITDILQVGAMPMPNGELSTSAGFRIYSTEAKGRYLCANGGGAGAKTGLYAIPAKTITVYAVRDEKITIKGKEYPIKLKDGYYIIRKLTVSECKRLQTVPDWYDFSCVSNSQAYKMLGNGWTVEVIVHLIRRIIDTEAAA